MRQYHTTPTVNLPSIMGREIDPREASGQIGVVYSSPN